MRRAPVLTAAAVVAVLALAACSGGDVDGGGPTGEDELTPISVGVMPIVDTAPIWLGVEEGIFADHGLDVTPEILAGGAAVVPTVVSGEHQFGFSNTISVLQAVDQGLDLQVATSAVASTGDESADMGAIVAGPETGITGAGDLTGRTVAVNALSSIGTALVSHVVDLNGGDSSTIDFVELPFPEIPAALASGNVDAAWLFEPFITIAEGDGATVASYLLVETHPQLQISVYFTTSQYAAQEPEIYDAFVSAMEEALDLAEEKPDAAREVIGSYTEIAPELVESIVMPRFPSTLDIESLEVMAEISQRYGLIGEDFDVADVLP